MDNEEPQLRQNFKGVRIAKRPATASKPGLLRRLKPEPKHRPHKQPHSRIDLYDINLQLKSQINSLTAQNLKLGTRAKFLEKDTKKEETEHDKGHLAANLKLQLRDLQRKIDEKSAEIADLKKNPEYSKYQETEIEMKMYIDECTRLNRMREESLAQLTMGVAARELQEKFIQQALQLKSLKRDSYELSSLSDDLKFSDGTKGKSRKNDVLFKFKQTLTSSKEAWALAQAENEQLKLQLDTVTKESRCPGCNKPVLPTRSLSAVVWDIYQAIEHRNLLFDNLWESLSPSQQSVLQEGELRESLERIGVFLDPAELGALCEQICAPITADSLLQALATHKPQDLVTHEMVQDVLTHFSFRMQVRRVPYEQVPHLFFQEPRLFTQDEVAAALQKEPAQLELGQAQGLTEFLFGSTERLPAEELIARLFDILEPWELVTEEKESELDGIIKGVVRAQGGRLRELLTAEDASGKGTVNSDVLRAVFRTLQVEIPEEVYKYLALLFYTDQFRLNVVPYLNFLQAYGAES